MCCVREIERPWAPGAGRTHIGKYQTKLTEPFWRALVDAAGIELNLRKCRGDNAHHIVEATFKSFARCLRATMDQMEAGASTNLHAPTPQLFKPSFHPYVSSRTTGTKHVFLPPSCAPLTSKSEYVVV